MYHFFQAITNTKGDSLIGYFARLIDTTSGAVVTLASDANGTPISTVSGVTNMAKTDGAGNLDFYVEPGTYHWDIFGPDATTFIRRDQYLQFGFDTDLATFVTVATATSARISAAVNQVQVAGFSNVLDQGTANYRRVVSEPTHPGKFQSADGAWWELAEDKPGPHHFGALSGGDATNGWQNAITYASVTSQAIYPIDGLYMIGGPRQGVKNAILALPVNGGPIAIHGSGRGCILKVPDGYTTDDDYSMLGAISANPTDDVEISGIAFDGNAANNLTIDSFANIRGAYAIKIFKGKNLYIHDCYFRDLPGQGTINAGNNGPGYDLSDCRILNCRFRNAGGAIAGNENCNDHSSIYVQSDGAWVEDNTFINDNAAFDPFAEPEKAVTALEIHGRNTSVKGNFVFNYGGNNIVASVSDHDNSIWEGNQFLGMKGNALMVYTYFGYHLRNIKILNNTIEIDNSTSAGGTGIYQFLDAAATSTPIEDLDIRGNTIFGTNTTATATTTNGVQLAAVRGLKFFDNTLKNIQGSGLILINGESQFGVQDAVIDRNHFHNVGLQSVLTRIWAFHIENTDTGTLHSDITFGELNTITADYPAVGGAAKNCQGIRITGPGPIQNVSIAMPAMKGIIRANRVSFITPTNNKNVAVRARVTNSPSAADPTFGYFAPGHEIVYHTDPTAGGYIGRVPTTAGCGFEATWAADTAYKQGQWVKFSTNKFGLCLVGGTSGGGSAPAPTTLGTTLTDGTVTWWYADTAAAVFKTFGAISA